MGAPGPQPTQGLLQRPFPRISFGAHCETAARRREGSFHEFESLAVFYIAIYGLSYNSSDGLYHCPEIRHDHRTGDGSSIRRGEGAAGNPSDGIPRVDGRFGPASDATTIGAWVTCPARCRGGTVGGSGSGSSRSAATGVFPDGSRQIDRKPRDAADGNGRELPKFSLASG